MPTLGIILLAWFISIWINIIVMLLFINRHLECLERKLSGCLCVEELNKSLKYGGFIGKHMRFNIIFMITYMPGILYRKGLITSGANLKIPRHLKWKIWGLYAWLFANVTTMAVLYWIIKTTK